MIVEFEHNDEIIAKAELSQPLYEDESVKIHGVEYVVKYNWHDVEIDENDNVHERCVCQIFTEEEWNG